MTHADRNCTPDEPAAPDETQDDGGRTRTGSSPRGAGPPVAEAGDAEDDGGSGLAAGAAVGAGIGAAVALRAASDRSPHDVRTLPAGPPPEAAPAGRDAPGGSRPDEGGASGGGSPGGNGSSQGGTPGGNAGVSRPGGLGRALGIGAVSGLGGVAAAGLVGTGHTGGGHGSGAHAPHQGTAHAEAVPGGVTADQGYTPLDPRMDPPMPATDPGLTGAPGTAHLGSGGSAGTVAAHPGVGGSPGTVAANPAAQVSAPPTHALHAAATAGAQAGVPAQPGLAGQMTSHVQPAGSDTTALYDKSGHQVGTVDPSGTFTALPGGTAQQPVSSDGSAPIFYDASGHPIATTDAGGHVVPLSSAGAPGQTAPPGTAQDPATGTHGTPQGTTQQAGETQPQTSGEPTYTYTYPPMTDEQRLWYDPLSLTPQQRDKVLREEMAKNGVKLPPVDGKDIPVLPDSFWQKDGYDYNGKTLTPVEAAATIYGMASSFTVDINELGTLAGHMDQLYQTLFDAWAKLYGKIANLNIDDGVFGDDENLSDFHKQYTDTTTGHSDGAIQVLNGLTNEAGGLRQNASAYLEQENTNLGYFGVTAVDPRKSAMDRARYQNGQDMSDHYPYWYFDTGDPRSPFHKKS